MSGVPAKNATEALRWAVQSQRGLAFNLGFLDLPLPDDETRLPDTWQMLTALHEVEYTQLNDFIVRRMVGGETLTPEWRTRPPDGA